MKRTHRCPKCGYGRILHIATVADRAGDLTSGASTPMKLAHMTEQLLGVFVRSHSAGELEAGVCRRCGYTELYVKDPGSIPIDGVHVRELVAPGGEEPPPGH
ncbi:hypothetical protein [Sandaracinus amylolyticus]|uniref:hypothetical protein n=1 Tax=Sandaracinus amylolyticus TaxID=927083 RepID=UPI001F2AC26E|nr:hypothetical protein [Sandaracinus amylolyticus]UJR83221.1 Hypothetical protein I5071_52880 [Sandaracinus amylolyticus]